MSHTSRAASTASNRANQPCWKQQLEGSGLTVTKSPTGSAHLGCRLTFTSMLLKSGTHCLALEPHIQGSQQSPRPSQSTLLEAAGGRIWLDCDQKSHWLSTLRSQALPSPVCCSNLAPTGWHLSHTPRAASRAPDEVNQPCWKQQLEGSGLTVAKSPTGSAHLDLRLALTSMLLESDTHWLALEPHIQGTEGSQHSLKQS